MQASESQIRHAFRASHQYDATIAQEKRKVPTTRSTPCIGLIRTFDTQTQYCVEKMRRLLEDAKAREETTRRLEAKLSVIVGNEPMASKVLAYEGEARRLREAQVALKARVVELEGRHELHLDALEVKADELDLLREEGQDGPRELLAVAEARKKVLVAEAETDEVRDSWLRAQFQWEAEIQAVRCEREALSRNLETEREDKLALQAEIHRLQDKLRLQDAAVVSVERLGGEVELLKKDLSAAQTAAEVWKAKCRQAEDEAKRAREDARGASSGYDNVILDLQHMLSDAQADAKAAKAHIDRLHAELGASSVANEAALEDLERAEARVETLEARLLLDRNNTEPQGEINRLWAKLDAKDVLIKSLRSQLGQPLVTSP